MAEVKWIKLSTNMFEDEKIRLIESMPEADTILVIWVKLLSQAGKVNASGYIFLSENIPYNEEMLSTIFNRPVGIVRMALDCFRRFGMIEIDDHDFISISNWEKHQNIDGLDKIREQNRLRKQKEREAKKLKALPLKGSEGVSCDSHVTVMPNHATELDIELEKESNKELYEPKPKKEKTSVQQVEQFDLWWNLYNNKKGRKKCETKYLSLLKTFSHESIMKGTEAYLQEREELKRLKKFCPEQKNPLTFLNGEHFNDEYNWQNITTAEPQTKGGGLVDYSQYV